VDRSPSPSSEHEDRGELLGKPQRDPIHLGQILHWQISDVSDSKISKARWTVRCNGQAIAIENPAQSRKVLGKTMADPKS